MQTIKNPKKKKENGSPSLTQGKKSTASPTSSKNLN
jgi:hypothetical protein